MYEKGFSWTLHFIIECTVTSTNGKHYWLKTRHTATKTILLAATSAQLVLMAFLQARVCFCLPMETCTSANGWMDKCMEMAKSYTISVELMRYTRESGCSEKNTEKVNTSSTMLFWGSRRQSIKDGSTWITSKVRDPSISGHLLSKDSLVLGFLMVKLDCLSRTIWLPKWNVAMELWKMSSWLRGGSGDSKGSLSQPKCVNTKTHNVQNELSLTSVMHVISIKLSLFLSFFEIG